MSVQQAPIYFGPSEIHGQGVFAARDIEEGETIEICPVLLFDEKQLPLIRQTFLEDYYFDWENNMYAVCLGLGSLYNHQIYSNADYEMDLEALTIDFYAVKKIGAGEEITVNYNGQPGNTDPVWFEKNGEQKEF